MPLPHQISFPFEGTLVIACGDSILLDTALGLANRTWNIPAKLDYSYSWYVFDGGRYLRGNLNIDEHYIIHGGSTDGFLAMLTIVEEGELIVTHLSNIGNQTNVFKLSHDIIKHYLN